MSRTDDFQGDNAHLVECINALLDMDDAKALVPHGLGKGSHAYRLLNAAAHRIATDLNRANEIIAEKEAEIAELRRTDAITMAGFQTACEQRDRLAARCERLEGALQEIANGALPCTTALAALKGEEG